MIRFSHIMLPDIILGEIKLENILSMEVFEWLVILVRWKIYEIKALEASEYRKLFVPWWSL